MFEKKNIKIIAGILVYALIMVGIFTPFSIFEKGEAQKDEIDMAIELIRSAIASALEDAGGWLPINTSRSYPLTNLVDLVGTIPIIDLISVVIKIGLGILGALELILPITITLIFIIMILLVIQLLTFFMPPIVMSISLFRILILYPIIILSIHPIASLASLGLGIWGILDLVRLLLGYDPII